MELLSVLSSVDGRSFLIGIFVFLLLFWVLRRQQHNQPPGPRGWPIIGNLPQLLMSKEEIHVTISKLTKT